MYCEVVLVTVEPIKVGLEDMEIVKGDTPTTKGDITSIAELELKAENIIIGGTDYRTDVVKRLNETLYITIQADIDYLNITNESNVSKNITISDNPDKISSKLNNDYLFNKCFFAVYNKKTGEQISTAMLSFNIGFDKKVEDVVKDKLQKCIKENKKILPKEYYHKFVCTQCERTVLVEGQDLDNLYGEDDWPEKCPYCSDGTMYLDMKHEFIPVKSVDVRTFGWKTEDIEVIEHL